MTAATTPTAADVDALMEWARREAGGDVELAFRIVASLAMAAGRGASAGFLRRPPAPTDG